jgi:hypothetical protein
VAVSKQYNIRRNEVINTIECWNEINMQDVAESYEFCKVVCFNPSTNRKESHIMVPSGKVLEAIQNGGLKVNNGERYILVSVDPDNIDRLW